jgi:hypothetical protein
MAEHDPERFERELPEVRYDGDEDMLQTLLVQREGQVVISMM